MFEIVASLTFTSRFLSLSSPRPVPAFPIPPPIPPDLRSRVARVEGWWMHRCWGGGVVKGGLGQRRTRGWEKKTWMCIVYVFIQCEI